MQVQDEVLKQTHCEQQPFPKCTPHLSMGTSPVLSAHTCLIESVLHDALHIVTGCLRLTPMDYLLILTAIQLVEICQQGASRNLMDLKHLFHQLMARPITAHEERLRSKNPFILAAHKLFNELSKLSM